MKAPMENQIESPKRLNFCVGLWYFVSGCEMSCYQPIFTGTFFQKEWLKICLTLDYLHELGVSDAWMGLLVASYGVAAMICSPIYGRITDYYKMSRYVVLVASLFSLIGHFTLITFRSEYGILLGKIGIGFGMSCDGLVSKSIHIG